MCQAGRSELLYRAKPIVKAARASLNCHPVKRHRHSRDQEERQAPGAAPQNALRVLREPEGTEENEHQLDRDVDRIHRTVVSGRQKRCEPWEIRRQRSGGLSTKGAKPRRISGSWAMR